MDRLRDYAKSKHAVVQAVRSICSLAHEAKNDKARLEGQELMTKLAEDRFTLAVVGQFKRGKSSLMNAIIGRELLPTGVLPLTSAITILKYGPAEKLTIQRDGDIFPEQPPVNMLAAYVTEQGNPGNQRKVKAAVLEEPIPFLRRGLEFVDTPGVGSAILANTETTYALLPECDAVVFVTGVDGPLTEAEMDFLRCTRSSRRRCSSS
jgi:ribosome biogenesis GTPase A